MPILSAFTPCGLLACSGAPSEGEKIYKAAIQAYTDPISGRPLFDLSKGTDLEARIYATAMAIARARATVQRANNENNPAKAGQMLPSWEAVFRIAPSPTASISARRGAVTARALVARGSRYEAITDGLTQILGTNFLAYRPLAPWEATTWPANPATDAGNFARSDLPARVVRMLNPVVQTSTSATIPYENWNVEDPALDLVVGDMLCVQPENLGLSELVTVTATTKTATQRTFTALFAKAHDLGASATTGPAPIWWSTKRFALIIVKAAAAIDTALRQRVDDYMGRVARTVTQWAIVQPTSPGATTVGTFTLGLSPLGVVPIGTLNLTPVTPSAPVVTLAAPSSGVAFGGTAVTITGSGFKLVARVQFSGAAADATGVVVVNDTTITCYTPTRSAGASSITVITPYGVGVGAGLYTFF
jgi:hypothetical protein